MASAVAAGFFTCCPGSSNVPKPEWWDGHYLKMSQASFEVLLGEIEPEILAVLPGNILNKSMVSPPQQPSAVNEATPQRPEPDIEAYANTGFS